MFPPPFQTFSWVNFYSPEFFMTWALGGVILGAPILLAIFCLARLRFFQRLRSQRVAWLLPLMGLMFGLASGWFTAWDDHHNYIAWTHSNDQLYQQDHWYEIFGIPGVWMAGSYLGDFDENGDLDEDGMWDFRSDIAIVNGLFWLSIAVAGVFVFRFAAKWWRKPVPLRALPGNAATASGG